MTTRLERLFVWAGGGAFVASLAITAWTYAVRFAVDRPAAGGTAVALDAALLSIFALHHSVFAREPVKRRIASVVPQRLLRSVYVWIASFLLILVVLLWEPVGGTLYQFSGSLSWAFAAVQIVGVWFIARSVRAISALELAGIRIPKMTNDELKTDSVYRLVRHPLYFGWLLIVFGAAHMTGDRMTFAVLTTSYLVIAMPWEERSLERDFGVAYRNYQAKVRWRIVPYLY